VRIGESNAGTISRLTACFECVMVLSASRGAGMATFRSQDAVDVESS